jgi:hypothetical protein
MQQFSIQKKTCVNWPPKSVLAATTPTVGITTRENEVAGNSTTVAAAATATTSKLNNNASKDVTEDLRHASPNHLKQSKNRSRQVLPRISETRKVHSKIKEPPTSHFPR